ncbi:hypothetical protein DYI37_03120 [Fulvimarina endophytica]|uniref:Uncharacterized protein n=2 Tax=Fulvimarina endophytica TaxID=2293836 RepID=A0A371XB61_9HYPH|nr:hypothetical protein DYI37_03120 [Fulvimarina endophytica]
MNLNGRGKVADVFLNGEEVKKVEEANEEEGYLVRCVLSENGRVQADPNDRERIWTERLDGNVRIVIRDRP